MGLDRIQTALQGIKTYIILALWVLAEVAGFQGWLDAATVETIRAVAMPAAGFTMAAKINRAVKNGNEESK